MTPIQIILLTVLGIMFIAALIQSRRRRISFRTVFVITSIWAIGSVAVAWPDLTTLIARAIGIGRGADLLLYLTVIVMFTGFFMFYLRIVRLRRFVTQVVRHLAIENAEGPYRVPGGEVSEK